MADLRPVPGRNGAARDEAQLLLTGAFVIGVLFVALALLLNSAIFTENLSARGSTEDAGHVAVQLRADAAAATAETLQYVNAHNNSTHATLASNLSTALEDWSTMSAHHDAVTGGSTGLALVGTTDVTYVRQRNATLNMTDAADRRNWTVVDGPSGVSEFEVAVVGPSLVAPPASSSVENLTDAGVFRVEVSDGTDTWQVFAYRDGTGRVAVAVGDPSGSLSAPCTVSYGSDPVEFDLANGTLDGADCSALSFFDSVAVQRIEYRLGTNATGTYSLVVGGTVTGTTSASSYSDLDADTGPYATGRFTGATVRLTHRTTDLHYRVTIPVSPGDADD